MPRRCFTFALCLLLTACNMASQQQAGTSSPQIWFDMPLPGAIFYPPNPCLIVAHGASPHGIAAFELVINGQASALPSPDTTSSLVTLSRECLVTEPGDYTLQLRAQDNNGNWSEYAETYFVIAGEVTLTPELTFTPIPTLTPEPTFTPIPTLTPEPTFTPIPTLTPTVTSTPEPAEGVTVERISTNLVYLGRSDCGTNEVTVIVRAVAAKGIKVVVLFYRFETGNSSSGFESVAMKPIGGDLYEATLNPTSLLGGSVPFEQATLQYQVVIQQNDGDTSLRTPVNHDIEVQACGSASSGEQPPANACSSYTDERSCRAHGCNWVSIPGLVPIYECRAP